MRPSEIYDETQGEELELKIWRVMSFLDVLVHDWQLFFAIKYLCADGPVEPADVTGVPHVTVDPGRDQLMVGLLRTLNYVTEALAGVKHGQLS